MAIPNRFFSMLHKIAFPLELKGMEISKAVMGNRSTISMYLNYGLFYAV